MYNDTGTLKFLLGGQDVSNKMFIVAGCILKSQWQLILYVFTKVLLFDTEHESNCHL